MEKKEKKNSHTFIAFTKPREINIKINPYICGIIVCCVEIVLAMSWSWPPPPTLSLTVSIDPFGLIGQLQDCPIGSRLDCFEPLVSLLPFFFFFFTWITTLWCEYHADWFSAPDAFFSFFFLFPSLSLHIPFFPPSIHRWKHFAWKFYAALAATRKTHADLASRYTSPLFWNRIPQGCFLTGIWVPGVYLRWLKNKTNENKWKERWNFLTTVAPFAHMRL